MARTLLVVDDLSDWDPYYPSEQIMTFENYLAKEQDNSGQRVRVINLSRSYRYLSDGYYCSLLAEARGHHVIPSVKTLNDLSEFDLYQIQLDDLSETLKRALKKQKKDEELTVLSFFGAATEPALEDLSRMLFEKFPCPVLEMKLRYRNQWEIFALRAVSHRNLDDISESVFASALDKFSKKIWRKGRLKRAAHLRFCWLSG